MTATDSPIRAALLAALGRRPTAALRRALAAELRLLADEQERITEAEQRQQARAAAERRIAEDQAAALWAERRKAESTAAQRKRAASDIRYYEDLLETRRAQGRPTARVCMVGRMCARQAYCGAVRAARRERWIFSSRTAPSFRHSVPTSAF